MARSMQSKAGIQTLFQHGPMESQPILVIQWVPSGEAHAHRFMVLGLSGHCYAVIGQLELSECAAEVVRGCGLEGVPYLVASLSSHHLHHHHRCHNQRFLEEGNLGLSVSRTRQQTKAWRSTMCGSPWVGPQVTHGCNHRPSDLLVDKGASMVSKSKSSGRRICHLPHFNWEGKKVREHRGWGGHRPRQAKRGAKGGMEKRM